MIRLDQEYESCHPLDGIRIRVIHAGPFEGDRALVATIHHDPYGREFLDRRRMIKLSSLHADGRPRKTGYRLVKDAPAVTP